MAAVTPSMRVSAACSADGYDPVLLQDIADGEALRRLREAVGTGWHPVTIWHWWPGMLAPDDSEEFKVEVKVRDRVFRRASGPTIAEAADACRLALEGQR